MARHQESWAAKGLILQRTIEKYTLGYDERVSFPTQVFETEKGNERPESSKRIDYILVSPSLSEKCINAKVLNQKETFNLSDHYPVIAEFNFEIK
jgi:exodeoxyribonuclease-3